MRRTFMLLLMALCVAVPAFAGELGDHRAFGSFAVLEGMADALEDGDMIHMDVGELLHIMLDANATTGYMWVCNIADETIITLVGEGYALDSSADLSLDGIGGVQHFFFLVLASGESEVLLRYKQPWMEDGENDDLYACMVLVE